MAASIATEININFICKPLFYIIVRKHMMIAYAHGACDCSGYPGQSAQSDGHVEGQHDVSENALLWGGGGAPLTDE